MTTPDTLLSEMFAAAVDAARPERNLARHLPARPRGRVIVIGAGKASAAMARVVEQHIEGPVSGCVVTRYGHAVPCEHIHIVEAAHPVPDEAGSRAARQILGQVSDLTADDLVIALISGGGSALLPMPAPGITLADKQQISKDLLRSGATISQMNTVRRHLSAIKGGHLAAACHPARVVNLIISDVPGDNPADVASGPTVADASTCADALAILERYQVQIPDHVRRILESGASETIKPDDPRMTGVDTRVIASSQHALMAAADVARKAGITPLVLGDAIEGESREVAIVMAAIAAQVRRHGQPVKPPCVLLSGGETTVTVRGNGRGGRNVEFLLSLALALQGADNIFAVAGDTDGVDGQEEIAGAFIFPDTLERARAMGMQARDYLDSNNAHEFFEHLGNSLVTGPTLTN
ncbi:MAG TPA: glycerate kinase, partial [Burkholderiaceae bacterium]|nr:glycerate kinase [Burkholderiaceae bacterium]